MTDQIAWTKGEAFTRANEGERLCCYDDFTGHPLLPGDICEGTPTIGRGHTGPDVTLGLIWTSAQSDHAFMIDYAVASYRARQDIGTAVFDELDSARQAALTDMAFQMGGRGLDRFANMIAAVQRRDWPEAVRQAQASVWARKTASRAARVEALLETGIFP